MIRKFLLIGKHVMISSSKVEDDIAHKMAVDLQIPIETYWEVKRLISKADQVMMSEGESVDVQEIYKKIFRHCAPYAVFETDRLWLHKHSKETANYLSS